MDGMRFQHKGNHASFKDYRCIPATNRESAPKHAATVHQRWERTDRQETYHMSLLLSESIGDTMRADGKRECSRRRPDLERRETHTWHGECLDVVDIYRFVS